MVKLVATISHPELCNTFQKLKTFNAGIDHQTVCINLRGITESYFGEIILLFCCGHCAFAKIIIMLSCLAFMLL